VFSLRVDAALIPAQAKNRPAQTDICNKLRDEIRQLDSLITLEEAQLGLFKRSSTRNFMALKLGGLLEFGEKATVRPACSPGRTHSSPPLTDRWRARQAPQGTLAWPSPRCPISLTSHAAKLPPAHPDGPAGRRAVQR